MHASLHYDIVEHLSIIPDPLDNLFSELFLFLFFVLHVSTYSMFVWVELVTCDLTHPSRGFSQNNMNDVETKRSQIQRSSAITEWENFAGFVCVFLHISFKHRGVKRVKNSRLHRREKVDRTSDARTRNLCKKYFHSRWWSVLSIFSTFPKWTLKVIKFVFRKKRMSESESKDQNLSTHEKIFS